MASELEINQVNIEIQSIPRLSRFLGSKQFDFSDYEKGFRGKSFSQMSETEVDYIIMMLDLCREQEIEKKGLLENDW